MRGPGKQLGSISNLKSEAKWRCATCKQANDNDLDSCARCKDPKRILIEKKAPRASSGPSMNQGPMRFTKCKKDPSKNKAAVAGAYAKGLSLSKPQAAAASNAVPTLPNRARFVP